MVRESLVSYLRRLLKRTLLINLATFSMIGGVCWQSGFGSLDSYGAGLVVAGLVIEALY